MNNKCRTSFHILKLSFFSFFKVSANHMEDATFTESMREQKTLDTMTEFEKTLRKDGYRAGWNDRADHDRELIEDAAFKIREIIPKKSYVLLKIVYTKIGEIYHLNEKETVFINDFHIVYHVGKTQA